MTAALTYGDADPSMGLVERKHVKSQRTKCSAHSSRTGTLCQRYPLAGATVCLAHGGAAPQVQKAARRRLEQAADMLVQRLLSFALDGDTSYNVAPAAVIAALDRAGISVKPAATVEVTVEPWEQVFEGISKVVAGPRDPNPAWRLRTTRTSSTPRLSTLDIPTPTLRS